MLSSKTVFKIDNNKQYYYQINILGYLKDREISFKGINYFLKYIIKYIL